MKPRTPEDHIVGQYFDQNGNNAVKSAAVRVRLIILQFSQNIEFPFKRDSGRTRPLVNNRNRSDYSGGLDQCSRGH